jgi:hypothetical protein
VLPGYDVQVQSSDGLIRERVQVITLLLDALGDKMYPHGSRTGIHNEGTRACLQVAWVGRTQALFKDCRDEIVGLMVQASSERAWALNVCRLCILLSLRIC